MLDEGCELTRRLVRGRTFSAILQRSMLFGFLAALAFSAGNAVAENCLTATDMDAATRSALTNSGLRYFDMIARGDAASLRQNAIPSLASDFSGIEGTVKENQPALAGSKASLRPPFLLEAQGPA